MNINDLDSVTQDQLRRRMRELGLDAAPLGRGDPTLSYRWRGPAAPVGKKG